MSPILPGVVGRMTYDHCADCGLPISQWFTRCAACDPHHDHDTH